MVVAIEIILGTLVLLVVTYVGVIIYINRPKGKLLAKELEFRREWSEVTLPARVKPKKHVQYIGLRIKDFKHDRRGRIPEIKLPDGTVVNPEVELYDEFGNKFEFHHSGFVTKRYEDIKFTAGRSKRFMKLPADRRYTKLRIRSDSPFSCEEVYWQDYNSK